MKPLAPERYSVQMTLSRDTIEVLRRVQDLMRHVVPDGDPAVIFDRALRLLLEDLERRRLASCANPRASTTTVGRSRVIPAAVRRAVWRRDAGRCAFVGGKGRCSETGFLEFHHVRPFADGGDATEQNIELRCRAHNQYEADLFFGPLIARERRASFTWNSVRTEFGDEGSAHASDSGAMRSGWRLHSQCPVSSSCSPDSHAWSSTRAERTGTSVHP